MDKVNARTRSRIMSRIRWRDTKCELVLRPELEAMGFEYHPKDVLGRPDFAHNGQMVAVFIDGCFWHGCPEHYRAPQSNIDFWAGKLALNRARDSKVNADLEALGWRVIRVWEHCLKHLI